MPELQAFLTSIRRMLADRACDALEALSQGRRLRAADFAKIVAAYGRRLTPPPEDAFYPSIVAIRGAEDRRWSVVPPLVPVEEGRSDPALVLTVTRSATGGFDREIDDLHVLSMFHELRRMPRLRTSPDPGTICYAFAG